jgi:hypothetical protein
MNEGIREERERETGLSLARVRIIDSAPRDEENLDSVPEGNDPDSIRQREDGIAIQEEEEDSDSEGEDNRIRDDLRYSEIMEIWRRRRDLESSRTLIQCLRQRLSDGVGLWEEVAEPLVFFVGNKGPQWENVERLLSLFLESLARMDLSDNGIISLRYAAAVDLTIDLLLRHPRDDIGAHSLGALVNLSLKDEDMMNQLPREVVEELFMTLDGIIEGLNFRGKMQSMYLIMRIAKVHAFMTMRVVVEMLRIIPAGGVDRTLRLECLKVLLNWDLRDLMLRAQSIHVLPKGAIRAIGAMLLRDPETYAEVIDKWLKITGDPKARD